MEMMIGLTALFKKKKLADDYFESKRGPDTHQL